MSSLIQHYKNGSDKQHATAIKRLINNILESTLGSGPDTETGSTYNYAGCKIDFDINHNKKEALIHFAKSPKVIIKLNFPPAGGVK